VSAEILAPEDIHAELGEVLLGRRSGREGEELIVCDLTGVGAQDAAIAGVVWDLLA
jgi:ornithine cyclodeaminase/alanine dehydrogenase-like protein (mu-crystallin family)